MKRRVLVIDDAHELHQVVADALAPEEIAVSSAFDGLSGLRTAIEQRPDLILLDLTLPDIDGWEVCELLTVQDSTARTPVVILSGASDRRSVLRALELGAQDYICKPFDFDELRGRVRRALRYGYFLQFEATRAQIDPLTGLWNRRYFEQRLSAETSACQRHGRPLSCVMSDIDLFKKLNDKYGHPAGDDALRTVAEVMRETCRREDVICRYGGEEFAILCPDVKCDGAAVLAERLRTGISNAKLTVPGVHVTCSFGVTDSAAGTDSLIARADAALYRAKQAGRNRVAADTAAVPKVLDKEPKASPMGRATKMPR